MARTAWRYGEFAWLRDRCRRDRRECEARQTAVALLGAAAGALAVGLLWGCRRWGR